MTKALKLVLICFVGAAFVIGSPQPKLIREINLNAIIHEPTSLLPSNHSVLDLAFSPDEKWVALAVGRHRKPGPLVPGEFGASHVVVVPFSDPQAKSIQLEPGVGAYAGILSWSPDSRMLIVRPDLNGDQPELYALPSGGLIKESTKLGVVLGFVARDRLLAYPADDPNRLRVYARRQTVFDTFDIEGRFLESWIAPDYWAVFRTSPDRHLAIVGAGWHVARLKTFIFDYETKTVVRNWPEDRPDPVFFAEDGRSVCAVGMYGRDAFPAQCWDVDSGSKIAEFHGFKGGVPAEVSSDGSRILLSHIRLFRGIDPEYDTHSFHNRVVWDFRADKEIASFVPMLQETEVPFSVPPRDKRTEWGPCTISPTGKYLAEGSNGVLRIYELP
jgi:hypothetical protein